MIYRVGMDSQLGGQGRPIGDTHVLEALAVVCSNRRVDVPAAVPVDAGGTTLGGYVAAALMGLVVGFAIAWGARQ